MSALELLKERIKEVSDIGAAAAVLGWDQQCYMPSGSGGSRAEHLATLNKVAHEKFTSDEVGRLLEEAIKEAGGMEYDSDDASMLRVIQRNYLRDTKVPASLVAEESKTTSLAHEEWVKARAANDYEAFRPWLEKVFDIERRIADARGYGESQYDALLDPFEPGMTASEVDRIFSALRSELVQLVADIKASGVSNDDSILHRKYDRSKQIEVTNDIVSRIGFNLQRGRQDQAQHPFCTSFATDDVRITTRFDEHFLSSSVFASMHEAGHGMYEQGIPERFNGTALRGACSLGFHESQSRLWENQVGRSKPFLEFYFPLLRERFPESLGDVSVDDFYRSANVVSPSLIRVEADEVTYSLHIMLRFELEKELLSGTVDFRKLPELWNSKMNEYLGVTPDSDANGVLQDVHWSAGIIGYFPTYALGNIISGQLWQKVRADIPDLDERIRSGHFAELLTWLRKNVHDHANKFTPNELIAKITGGKIDAAPYVSYLQQKFRALYGLS